MIEAFPEGRLCHYCDLIKCPCCMYEVNYYYNYGFSRRKILLCTECYDEVYGEGRKVSSEMVNEALKKISEAIINSVATTINHGNRRSVDYFDAVKLAFDTSSEVRVYLGENCNIDKNLRGLWSFTYAIINGQVRDIMVLNKDPDNFVLEVDFKKICCTPRQ
jgi:hypothetical protein